MGRATIYDTLIEFLLVFLLVFTPLAYGTVQPWSIASFEVAAALMAFFWILKMLLRSKLEFINSGFLALFLILIGYASLQLFFARSIYPWATKTELLKIISYALIFLVVLNTITTKRQIIRILSIVVMIGFFMSIFFLMRYFGLKAPRGLINPDHFAGYLGMVIPLALGIFFNAERDKKALLFYSVLVMGAALFFTMSRGGMFSFIAGLLAMAFLASRRKSFKKKRVALSATVIFIALIIIWLGATPVIERIFSIKAEVTSRYFGGRLPIWQGAAQIIKDYPIFGTGLGTFSYIFPKYQPQLIAAKHYTYAHSDFLELLSEIGITGFSIFLFGLIIFIIYIFRHFRLRHDPYVVGLSIGIFGSLASIFIHSFADFNLHIPANAILLTLILALVTLVLNFKQDKFGERLDFRRKIFVFSKIHPVTDNSSWSIFRELFRVSLYLPLLIIIGFYIFSVLRAALADYHLRNTHNSIRTTQYAIRLDPTNALYYYELGKLYFKSNQLQEALVQYKKAVELNPTNSRYHQSLAWAYGNMGRDEEATREFEKAVSSEPNNPYRHRAYAIYCFDQAGLINNNANKARNSINPKESLLNTAIFEYRQAVNIDSSFAREAIERLFPFTKDYSVLKKVLPNLPEFHLILAGFLQEKNLWLENEEKFKMEMHNATDKAPYYVTIAQWHYRCKDYNKAFSILYDYLKLYPNNAEIHFTIADFAVYGVGNLELAFKEFKKALELEPKNASYRYWYAAHLFRNKKYPEAEKQFRKVIELNPGYSNRIEIFKNSGGKKAE